MARYQGVYTLHIPCPQNHVGYIVGRGGRGIRSLVEKWNGKIIDMCVNVPMPEKGRPDTHITIRGEERAVHMLGLEVNDMIKISMTRLETRYRCEMNKVDSKLHGEHSLRLKIAMLEEELKMLKSESVGTSERDEEDEDDNIEIVIGVDKWGNV